VTDKGVRSWSFRFSDPQSGKVTRQTFKGDLSLKEARAKAREARNEVAKGTNPVEQKRRDLQEATTRTFKALSDRYLNEHARRHKRTADADERALKLHVLPKWASRRFDRIGRGDVIELCEGIVAAGKPIQANRVQSLISKVFSFALDADLVTSNPCARLKRRSKETRGTRVLSDGEIRLFWRAIGQSPNSVRIGLALRLVLLTGVRVTELAGAELSEFDKLDDATDASWLIPASRSKNGCPHRVPLSELALDTVRELIEIAKGREEGVPRFLLASPTGQNRTENRLPIDGHALSVAMTRFGGTMVDRAADEAERPAAATWAADRPTAHDLRRTLATRLSAAGVPAEDVSACLNHARKGVTALHYDQYDRAREKRRALALWAQQVSAIVNRQGGAKVISMSPGASNVVPIGRAERS
jgi:integrase